MEKNFDPKFATLDWNEIDVMISNPNPAHMDVEDHKTSLHIAAEQGLPQSIEAVLKYASEDLKHARDRYGNTALHLASGQGHTIACQILIASGLSVDDVNLEGQTSLHLAAKSGLLISTLETLASCSFKIDARDSEGRSPLMIAIEHNNKQGVIFLLNHGSSLTLVNNAGFTPICEAIERSREDICLAILSHSRWKESLGLDSNSQQKIVARLAEEMPRACEFVLDRCITFSDYHDDHPDFSFTCDFGFLEVNPSISKKGEGNSLLTTKMTEFKRKELLLHPVTVQYLDFKWWKLGRYFYYLSLLLYLIYIISLTTLVVLEHNKYIDDFVQSQAPPTAQPNATTTVSTSTASSGTASDSSSSSTNLQPAQTPFGRVVVVWTLIFSFCMLLKEVLQMFIQRLQYFQDYTNFIELPLYGLSIAYLLELVFLLGWTNVNSKYQVSILAVFLAFFNLMLYLQRMVFFQVYVVMFMKVIGTLLHVFAVFLLPILGFAITYFLMLPKVKTYNSIGRSLVKSFMMLSGEFDYDDKIIDNLGSKDSDSNYPLVPFPQLSFVMEILFLFVLAVGLMNLLVGLAVGDIEKIQKDAEMEVKIRTADLTQQIYNYLPTIGKKKFYLKSMSVFPNKIGKIDKFFRLIAGETFDYKDSLIGVKKRMEEYESKQMAEKVNLKVFQRMERIEKRMDNLISLIHNLDDQIMGRLQPRQPLGPVKS